MSGLGLWFSSWAANTLMLGIGVPLVALPIIIHLLNKRKFKIVDWAAMDFLLDADKRNRRRVRLENLILLLLRCLAVLLIAFLLARPFLPTSLTAGLLDSTEFERIVLLDDSLSMQVRTGNLSALDEAKQSLTELLKGLVASRSNDMLTLLVASQPDQRIVNGATINEESIDEITDAITAIPGSDGTANMNLALQELERYIASQSKNVNRVVYIITDMRRRDWQPETRATSGAAEGDDPAKAMQRLAKDLTGCFLIDVGAEQQNNLILDSIRPEDTLVAGVTSRFDVTVSNPGSEAVRDLTVKFTAGEAIPQTERIDNLPAGKSEVVSFNFTFAKREPGTGGAAADTSPEAVQIRAEVTSAQPGKEDRLLADSSAFYAARVVPGIPALIVDGDPSATRDQAESFFLRPALSPPGDALSGIAADVATEGELETLSLGKYKVIFLCNLFHLGEKTLSAIEAWTRAGGGLVILPGDQVDDTFFNKNFYNDGQGLSPLRLEGIRGDETERTWVTFKIEGTNHPLFRLSEGQNIPFLEKVKTFRWWYGTVHKDQKSIVSVPVRFSDTEDSPAMAEKAYGKGRVVTFTIPADHDWSSWPDDFSYLFTMQEMVRYLVGKKLAGEGDLRVGEPIHQPVDLTLYKTDAILRKPDEKKVNVQAIDPAAQPVSGRPAEKPKEPAAAPEVKSDEATGSGDQVIWLIDYPGTMQRGFYELGLTRNNDEGVSQLLFAANVDPTEGNLKRADLAQFRKDLGDARVTIVSGKDAGIQGAQGTQNEIWKALLMALVIVLGAEQVLGWFFGRRR